MSLREYYWKLRKQYFKARIKYGQKSYGDPFPLRYFLQRERGSKNLIVVYSAFPETGKSASYHYVTTLSKIKANKLFLLDEYGPEGRGCYYLGQNKDFTIERHVKELISQIESKLSIEKTIHVGSSKGGTAALYFGLDRKNDPIIVGGAQYYLGDYTLERMPNLYTFLTGHEENQEDTVFLNSLVSQKVKEANPRTVYLHYSDAEHTYQDSMFPLINDLKASNFSIVHDVAHYEDHGEIGLYFAEYLPKILKEIL